MTLAYDRLGLPGATAVVLLHGIGGGRHIWADMLPALAAAGCDAIAVDLPGYGNSAAMAPGGVHLMAQSVLNLLDRLDLRQAVFVGHSMGGMVAQELAATAAPRVAGLVLACTSPAFGRPDGDWQARFVQERLAPLDAGQGMDALAAQLVPDMVGPGTPDRARQQARMVMAAVPEATYRRVLAALVAFDRRAALPGIHVPTLCLAGEHDRVAPPEVLRRMAQRIPGAGFEVLPGAGHVANVEQPQAFQAAVVDFLRRHAFLTLEVP
ncbi:MAG: alpha/beta hydrolase [Rubrivivax sp.]|nr:alpha/beta hydrolase [Rubrivivax sp.]MDH5338212.1 alpha/beta hydrolase [Rubrivivax sp.]